MSLNRTLSNDYYCSVTIRWKLLTNKCLWITFCSCNFYYQSWQIMWKNDSVVGDCNCDQFSQVKVCTEHVVDWTVSLQISYRPCLQPVEKKKDRQPSISRSIPHAVMMLLDVVYQQHWWIPTRLEKHAVTLKEWRPCKHASTNRHTCRDCAVITAWSNNVQVIKNGFVAISSQLSWSCETAMSSSIVITVTLSI